MFSHNGWICLLVIAAFLGAISGLYDKYLMAPVTEGGAGLNRFLFKLGIISTKLS